MEKLPQDFKEKWIAALRSGEFEQGRNALCRVYGIADKSYCCLGVAYRVFMGEDPYDTASGYIDGRIREGAILKGFPEILTGTTAKSDVVKSLVLMNDGVGDTTKSFSEIADYIEANL